MLPSIFEKHKICSNRTKSLLIVINPILPAKNNEDFAMERRFNVSFHPFFYNFISLSKTPLKSFVWCDEYFDLSLVN